ncbi:hypothetical protein Psta_1297 [Pirellula staleyi DSM 6068]|uniref:Glycosyltransferase 2-like domain-containing protein n=1 Tax=Pirellula staleyi (strain ATCC 27377 / DSM 6068 / ICPB 4128) TaxID=530564 RepID=D2QWA0_PIRSD|nr:hypothetical protein [Pirellula staleyi]ADB15975.1 hypothetical protein Psta_1297 [Pirellula staleyi DSM 6068]
MIPAENSSCVVLVPVGSQIEPACEAGLKDLEKRGYPVWRVRGYAAIDQGRNQMATDAIAQGFKETMWIDSDIAFDPNAVDRLRTHQLPITCGVYPKKGKRELAIHVLPGTEKIVFGKDASLTEIKYAATGFLHVRREVYLKVQADLKLPLCNTRWKNPMVPFFMPMVQPESWGSWYLAEDYAFSERARRCGYQVWADTSIRLGHIGSYSYSWEDAGSDTKRFASYTYHLTDQKNES